ncbi:MAG TPA: dTMP kinase [Gemmatimonadaceae bacterium]|nr:dTMP kinase [Gemmatimonadaceae bacterium]
MSRGRLIVFEGAEGAGKTTQLRRLSALLAARHVPHTTFQEPGGTVLGNEIRRTLLDPAQLIVPRAEALLFMASRAQLVEREIAPRLAKEELVLLDRFALSTYAYQVAGRGLPEDDVRRANALATGGLVPDLTLVLIVPADARHDRATRRGASDRIERAGRDFHERVELAFARFLTPSWQAEHPECGPIIGVDGSGSEAEVIDRIVAALAARWPETFPASSGSYVSGSSLPRS